MALSVFATPSWYSGFVAKTGWNAHAAGQGLQTLLQRQGQAPLDSTTRQIDFLDFDGTTINVQSPTPLVSKTTGQFLRMDPITGEPKELEPGHPRPLLLLGVSNYRWAPGELIELQAKWPKFNWAGWSQAFGDFNSLGDILMAPLIPTTAEYARRASREAGVRVLANTARGGDEVPAGVQEYSLEHGLGISGTLAMHDPEVLTPLGIPLDAGLTTEQLKSLGIVAANQAAIDAGSPLESNAFHDDTDVNLKEAVKTVGALYPNLQFRAVDVVHSLVEGRLETRDHFVSVPVSTVQGGVLLDGRGQPWTLANLEAYNSRDLNTYRPLDGYSPIPGESRWPQPDALST
jgi:hypothetical protein